MDNLTPEQRRKNMSRIRSQDTSIEIRLRKALWCEGFRYRKNYVELPGKPDVAITKYKIAVFCDSGFFHGKDFETKKPVGANSEYWDRKIRRNMRRDLEVERELKGLGWTVLRFWDDQINKNLDECVKAVKEAAFESRLRD